ncbi:MAG: hypothetical protein ACKO7P_12565, partial [Bacteroidota bacterium]
RRNLDHQLIRYLAATDQRTELCLKSLRFVFRYPNDPTIKEKIVFFVYNMPGGRWIQVIVKKIKKTTND